MFKIEVKNIFKSFSKKQVLKNISFFVKEGECFGLIGPNGAGKSTLIDIITGLSQPDSGEIYIDGKLLKDCIVEYRRNLGFVPQEIALIEQMTGRNNLIYFGSHYNLSSQEMHEKISELEYAFSLNQMLDKNVNSYSGGMKRKVNLATSLIHSPTLLILDEPTVGIDPKSRNDIFTYLKKLQNQGVTIIYTSNYIDEIENICDRLFIIEDGQKVAYGTKEDIKNMVSSNVKWSMEIKEDELNPSDLILVLKGLKEENIGILDISHMNNKVDLLVDPSKFSTNKLFSYLLKNNIELTSLMRNDLSLEESFLELTKNSK